MDADPLITGLFPPADERASFTSGTTVDAELLDLFPHLFGRHAGKLHAEVEGVGSDRDHRLHQPLGHFARVVGGDRLIRTESAPAA